MQQPQQPPPSLTYRIGYAHGQAILYGVHTTDAAREVLATDLRDPDVLGEALTGLDDALASTTDPAVYGHRLGAQVGAGVLTEDAARDQINAACPEHIGRLVTALAAFTDEVTGTSSAERIGRYMARLVGRGKVAAGDARTELGDLFSGAEQAETLTAFEQHITRNTDQVIRALARRWSRHQINLGEARKELQVLFSGQALEDALAAFQRACLAPGSAPEHTAQEGGAA